MNKKCSNMMGKIKPTKRKKLILFSLLIILNIILRIPSIPHAKGGGDSFVIQEYANSITRLGEADWWTNWLAVFGLYPYSYASAVPFSLSGISQLTGLDNIKMEYTLLLFSVVIGLFSIFAAYTLAGTIYNNFIFKYIMALFFSATQGVLMFSTWEVSARGPFVIYLPLFIFILFKKMHYGKKILFLTTLWIYLASVHHLFFFLVPFTGLYLFMTILLKIVPYWNREKYYNYLYIVGLIVILIYPFLTQSMIKAGSRYSWILDMLIINIRFVGPIIVLLAGGLIHLIFKKEKKFEEWYFLLAFLGVSIFLYNQLYGVYLVLLFSIFFISVAFKNIIDLKSTDYSKNNKIIVSIIVITIVFFSSFSSYYNHYRTGDSAIYWYMSEEEYKTAKWGYNHISDGEISIGPSLGLEYLRIVATTYARPFPPQLNRSGIEVIKVSPTSTEYYFEGPYVLKPNTSFSGVLEWLFQLDNVDGSRAQRIIKDVNAKYFIDVKAYHTKLSNSIRNTRNVFYDSGRINIWIL